MGKKSVDGNKNPPPPNGDDKSSQPPDLSDPGSPDPEQVQRDTVKAMTANMAAQSAIQLAGMSAQLYSASLNIAGQTVGATTAMAVQSVTDLVKVSKDAVKQQGEAFQKAN